MDRDLIRSNAAMAAVALLSLAGSGCGSSSTSSVTAPSATSKCQVSIGPTSSTFPPTGGSGSVTVSTNRDCAWTLESTAAWVRLGQANGQGEARVGFAIDRNEEYSERAAEIRASSGERVSVRQEAAPPPPPPPPPPPLPPPPPDQDPPPEPEPDPAPEPDPEPDPEPAPEPAPDAGQQVDLEGPISSLAGSCPTVQFSVRARNVVTDAATRYDDVDCGGLRNGMKVDVRGVVQANGVVLATRIERD